MYDLLFVKKRRRRKIAALVAFVSSLGVTSLVIISFLGRSVGTFTVALSNSEVKLALCEKKDSTNYSTYLLVNESYPYIEHSYAFLKNNVDDLDNDETKYNVGEKEHNYLDKNGKMVNGKVLEYFKYTFYVKNIGSKTASYDLKINIDDRTRADDNTGRSLDDTLRVMVFENDPNSDKHDYLVYAKKAAENNFDKNGKETDKELIMYDPNNPYSRQETDQYPLAETFKDGGTVAEYNVESFVKNDIKRYTIVIWLEGFDPQSKPDNEYPEGATLKLGVDIAAHENAKTE